MDDASEVDVAGRVLRAVSNDAGGEVGESTTFRFEQEGDLIHARYEGKSIRRGFLVGRRDGGTLAFRYAHVTTGGETASGAPSIASNCSTTDGSGPTNAGRGIRSPDPGEVS
ncbi:hypothetical protein ACNS7O_09330 [Haloferacaceae archaeon DSL9]